MPHFYRYLRRQKCFFPQGQDCGTAGHLGSVKKFVSLVKNGSFLVRIKIWKFLSERSIPKYYQNTTNFFGMVWNRGPGMGQMEKMRFRTEKTVLDGIYGAAEIIGGDYYFKG